MNKKILLLISMLLAACLSQFASDIYAPALATIANKLGSNMHAAQLSMAIFLFGVAFSLLFYGVISEIFGRKLPLIVGLIAFLLGSVFCSVSQTMSALIIGRLVQGLGAGAGAGLWRAIFRDIFTGEQLAKYGSYFTVMIMFVVPAAPALGGSLQHYFGWRAIFIFICLYALLALLFVFFAYTETNTHHHASKKSLTFIYKTFSRLLLDKGFMRIVFCTFLSYGAFFSWFTAGPILLTHTLKMSPLTFGWISAIGGGIAYALAGQLNAHFVARFGMSKMMRFGWCIMIFSGVLMCLGYFIFGVTVWGIFAPAILFYFGSTFVWPNAFATAMSPFGDIAGYAGSLYSFMQLAGGAVLSLIVANLPTTTQLPLSLVFIACSTLALWVYTQTS